MPLTYTALILSLSLAGCVALPVSRDMPASRDEQAAHSVTPLIIETPRNTGFIGNSQLDEISGLAVARRTPGLLFALNDSGNASVLFAVSESGVPVRQWQVDAPNRDWEDMATTILDGMPFLVLGDTGDNLRLHSESALYFVAEPSFDTDSSRLLKPAMTIHFRYEDGPRNVEAFAISGTTVYLISKEPVTLAGPRPGRLYTLEIPSVIPASAEGSAERSALLVARFIAELPLLEETLESRLAAAFAGLDLNHITALDFDESGSAAYLLTYRQVLKVSRVPGMSWADAFRRPAVDFHTHQLRQAEALAVKEGQSVWITSEGASPPLWALPVTAPY